MDEDGYVYYRSRRKEMIIVGGLNVYPVEVENLVMEHPHIAEAQVFGIPDQRYGEVVCAWVKVKAGQTIASVEDVRQFLSSKISFYKVPKHIKFVDSFTGFMTPTGKVQKFKLTDAMVKELSSKGDQWATFRFVLVRINLVCLWRDQLGTIWIRLINSSLVVDIHRMANVAWERSMSNIVHP